MGGKNSKASGACKGKDHKGKSVFTCDQSNCNNVICANCAFKHPTQKKKRICQFCKMNQDNYTNPHTSALASDAGGMDFDADDLANSKPKSVRHDVHIGFDRESNQIVGWDDLFGRLDASGKSQLEEIKGDISLPGMLSVAP